MKNPLDKRSQEILSHVVEAYVETGEPVGSRTLSKRLGLSLSPATIRNVMADLEEVGFLYAPHTSAGRLPTEAGLRLFVHGFLEVGALTLTEQNSIQQKCQAQGRSISQVLEEATVTLSGLSGCAGLVLAPKSESPLKHMEFVLLSPGQALVVLIAQDGEVENRVIDIPLELNSSHLIEATNYLNARLGGHTLVDARHLILKALTTQKGEVDALTSHLVEAGLAIWSGDKKRATLIVRGQANLLQDITVEDDLQRVRDLFEALDEKEEILNLLDAAIDADGVQIFIGAENRLFGVAGCSMIVAPYSNGDHKIVGAIGIIGPTRINYGKIIPMVDYTAKVIGQLLK